MDPLHPPMSIRSASIPYNSYLSSFLCIDREIHQKLLCSGTYVLFHLLRIRQGENVCKVGCIPCMLYPASGGTLDWTLGEAGIPYRCNELRQGQTYPTLPQLCHGVEGHRQLRVHPSPRPDYSHWRRSLGVPLDRGQADHPGVCSSTAVI